MNCSMYFKLKRPLKISHDLNTTENMYIEFEHWNLPRNVSALHAFCREEWVKIDRTLNRKIPKAFAGCDTR